MSDTPNHLQHTALAFQLAELSWDDEGQPLSNAFGDVYFSRANGLAETRHVFLQHNQLHERWPQLQPWQTFVIGETGFGSGLNFLAVWQLWQQIAPSEAQLHFVSVEKFPLRKADLARALALWPELHTQAQALINAYPNMVGTGFHRLNFMQGRVRLTLIIDDAARGFAQLLASNQPQLAHVGAKVDAWFLDGFAPAKNPQMWSPALFSALSKLSHTGTSAATFSAAGIVKQGLKNAGFSIEKVAGFGRKRDMVKALFNHHLEAHNPGSDTANSDSAQQNSDTSQTSWAVNPNAPANRKQALIIGGGLAGCSSARALAERGWQVTLLEQNSQLAQAGSGNPQGALYAKLSPKDEPLALFNLSCLSFAQRFYQPYWDKGGSQCGLLQLATNKGEQQQQQLLQEKFAGQETLVQLLSAQQASAIAGVALQHGGLYFPQAGWLNPASLCQQLVAHSNIQVHYQQTVNALQPTDDGWLVQCAQQQFSAAVVVIANARDAAHLSQCRELPIRSIRGQVSYLPATPASAQLQTVVCGDGYIAPAQKGMHCLGATFNLREENLTLTPNDQITNLDHLGKVLPQLAAPWQQAALAGRAAFRCTLPDYLPMLGPVPQHAHMLERFAPLKRNARARITQPGCYWPGLYLNIGHGSRGLAYTPLCAELLASQINGEPLPVARSLADYLNPGRFVIRDLIKNKL